MPEKFSAFLLVLIGAAIIFLSAKLSITLPGTSVPQSAQTLAILLIATLLPSYNGFYAVLLYLLAGTLGLPVFSDGGHGLTHLLGATGGYLLGFVIAALLLARLKSSEKAKKFLPLLSLMILAHLIILFLGWLWLSNSTGFSTAFDKGVAPFIVGGIVKSLLAAGIILLFQKYLQPLHKNI